MTEQELITKEFAPLPPSRYSARALKGELALPFPLLAPRLVAPQTQPLEPSRN